MGMATECSQVVIGASVKSAAFGYSGFKVSHHTSVNPGLMFLFAYLQSQMQNVNI